MPSDKWPFFPIFLRVAGRRVLVVGGGDVAARKIRLLARSQAHIDVVARELNEALQALVAAGELTHCGSGRH